jgi:hypothetical protein
LRAWHEKYAKEGLTIVGVHTPEFFWEKAQSKLEAAVKKLAIRYPVVLDNDYETWNRYGIRAWPTMVLVDKRGNIRYQRIGEGGYEESEAAIRSLLKEFTTLADPKQMPGVRSSVLDWPYLEGLRIDEAAHPLMILGAGLYGEVLPNQNGAPIRLVVPWKYGFKSIKSIVRIRFVEQQPVNTWMKSAPHAYGFYSNVNPQVDHPRWSQARERRIGEFFKRETLMFNGYVDQVAQLYAGMDLKKFF